MEAFLAAAGPFGRYQKTNFLLLSLPTTLMAMQKLAWVFLGAKVNHRCKLPWEVNNASYFLENGTSSLYYPNDSNHGYSQCQIYSDVGASDAWNQTGSVERRVSSCTEFIYDTSEYKSSAVIDYDLVCGRAWMRATVQSVFMVGMMVGSYIFGDLSDRYGRRPVFLTALTMMIFFGVGQVAILNYYIFTATRFFCGAALQGTFLTAYVLMMEMIGTKKRVVPGILTHAFYSFGYFLAAGVALAISSSSWRWLQVAYTLPALFFIPYYWIIPESVRWLSTKGRADEAEKGLRKVAKINKKKVPEELIHHALVTPPGENSANFLDLFRDRSLRVKTLIFFFNWSVNSAVYYGLSLNTSNLGGDDYLNFVISGAVELPALLFSVLILNKFGRRLPLCALLVAAGVSLLSGIFINKDSVALIIVVMMGKFCISATYAIIYMFTTESFPTVVRNVAVGSSSMIARIGGASAPYINLLGDHWAPLPYIIFGSLSVSGGILALSLEETKDRALSDFLRKGSVKEDSAE